MNILFLDIDGVLNSKRWYNDRPYEPIMARDEVRSERGCIPSSARH